MFFKTFVSTRHTRHLLGLFSHRQGFQKNLLITSGFVILEIIKLNLGGTGEKSYYAYQDGAHGIP